MRLNVLSPRFSTMILRAVSLLILLIGLVLTLGGAELIWIGGSSYYILAGIGLVAAAILCGRMSSLGPAILGLVLLFTILWSLTEVGLDFWKLVPRLAFLLAITLCTAVLFRFADIKDLSRKVLWFPAIGSAFAFVSLAWAYHATEAYYIGPQKSLELVASAPKAAEDWSAYGSSPLGRRYSSATQITLANVHKLKLAWTHRTGDWRGNFKSLSSAFEWEATPLKIADTLYICTPLGSLIALDADTGRQRWRTSVGARPQDAIMVNCRGVSYHRSSVDRHVCAARILTATVDGRLVAVDGKTGRRCQDFGVNGEISLKDGMGEITPAAQYTTSPPLIIGEVAVLGSYVRDNDRVGEPSGAVRAFDVYSGKMLWAFDAGNPGQRVPPPGSGFIRGSPNAWSVLSGDPKLGLVYLPMGNATPDFVGHHRTRNDEYFSSSIVALDARTGDVRWRFQTVHHDLWDYDIPAQPSLIDFPIKGGSIPALAAPTKTGNIFILDRRTGKPLTKVQERQVPQGNIPHERYAATQPFSTGFPNATPEVLREEDMWGISPVDQLWCRIRFRSLDYRGMFTPPSLRGSIEHPGNFGAINWGGISVDERNHLMVVNSSNLPVTVRLVPRSQADKMRRSHVAGAHEGLFRQLGVPYEVEVKPFLSPIGVPCVSPPWGALQAIDMGKREVVWKTALGTSEDIVPLGGFVPGIFNTGGSVVTGGGLIFIGATMDNYLRAFDLRSGKEVWKARLPAGGQATPMTYISPMTGKQYVVIIAGGHEFLGTTGGDYVLAYAL